MQMQVTPHLQHMPYHQAAAQEYICVHKCAAIEAAAEQ